MSEPRHDSAEPEPQQRAASGGSPIFSGLSWNGVSQAASLAVGVVLTPFLVLRLGLDRYGLYALVTAFIGLVSNLDGGFGATALRYFSVHVGSGARDASSQLLVTASLLLVVGAGTLGGVIGLFAPSIVDHLHASHQYYGQAALLVRLLVPVLVVSMLRDLLQALLAAHHRWRDVSLINTGGQICYAILAFSLVGAGLGTVGLVLALAGSEILVSTASLLAALRFVERSSCRPMRWGETRSFCSYAAKIQVAAIASMFNFEFSPLVIGLLLPIRFVALFSIGANFAIQLRTVPLNALGPIQVKLSQTFGRGGLRPTLDEHSPLQKAWTRTVTAVPVVGAAVAWFAISRWIGKDVAEAGVVAAVLLVGYGFNLLTGPLSALVYSINRPDVERDYGMLSAGLCAVLTIVLAYAFGVLGVAAATALSQILGSLWFLRTSRRRISSRLQSCFAGIPWRAVSCAVLVAVLLELPVYRFSPSGPVGLILCAIPAVVALGCYVAVAEPRLVRSSLALVRRRQGRRSVLSAVQRRDWAALWALLDHGRAAASVTVLPAAPKGAPSNPASQLASIAVESER